MRRLVDSGAQGFVEVGTGKVLSGLLRMLDKSITSWNVDDPASLAATLAGVSGGAPAATEPAPAAPPLADPERFEEAG